MAEAKRNTIVVACSVVACIATLMTCGILIGNIQGDVRNLHDDVKALEDHSVKINSTVSDMKQKQSYLEGVVSTKLDVISESVRKMELKVDKLVVDAD